MKRIILPPELSDASDFTSNEEFKAFVEKQMKNKSFLVGELQEGIPAGNTAVLLAEAGKGQSFIESYVNEFNKEKEAKKLEADGNEVYLITGGLIDALALGKPICINGVWIALSEKSEMRLVEGLENRWAEEWGLNAKEEEK